MDRPFNYDLDRMKKAIESDSSPMPTGMSREEFKDWIKQLNGQQCGCYYCCKTFDPDTVTEFVDNGKTAICPLCGVDSVITKIADKSELKELNTKWFGST